MKIEAANNTENIQTKIEKKSAYDTEDGFSFRDLIGGTGVPTSLGLSEYMNDYLTNSLLTSDEEDVNSLRASFKYDCLTMDRNDAMFFANSVKGENYAFSVNGEVLMQNQATSVQEVSQVYKSAEVSKTLVDMLANSQQTGKSVRIDFGNDISAIMKVSVDGKISAQFIPSDKAAEEYLRNNIGYLEQAFEEQEIPYTELSYRQQRQKRQDQQNSSNTNRQFYYQDREDEKEG